MVSRSLSIALLVGLVVGAGSFTAGCRRTILGSVWLDSSMTVNGQPDWWAIPSYEVKSLPGIFTLAGDSSAVYFHLRSTNRRLSQRLRMQGLTWRIRSADGKAEGMTIRYPIRVGEGAPAMGDRPPLPEAGMAPGAVFEMLALQNDDLEIVSGDSLRSGRKTREEALQLGVSTSLSEASGATEYTLRLSLTQTADWLRPGSRLIVDVESPAADGRTMRGRGMHGEGPPDGMRPPGGMGGGPRPGGGPATGKDWGEKGLQPGEALHLKYIIELASGPEMSSEKK